VEVPNVAKYRRRAQMTFARHGVPHSILGEAATVYLLNQPLRLEL
jgi:hypothetical protein